MSDSSSDEEEHGHNELNAWRQVHEQLANAVIIAKEAVAAKKLQRRFWLEEICANLTEEGKVTANSVWKRPVPVKKAVVKRSTKPKELVVKKRKPKAEPKPKKPRKKKSIGDDDEEGQPKKKKIRLKLNKEAQEAEPVELAANDDQRSQDASETVDDEDEEDEESETETGNPHETGASSLLRAADYASIPQWGSTPHGYMPPASIAYPGSAAAAPHSPYSGMYSQYPSYYGQSDLQAGLHSQGMYSTYSGPPAGDDEGDVSSSEGEED